MINASSRFQDDFSAALLTTAAETVSSHPLSRQPGFSVYRNTVLKGCIDALQANFPAVSRLVGDEWFRAAAAVYARVAPPLDSRLLDYGAGFADFLAQFPPAAELPYLSSVARLDRFWTEAHAAADGIPLEPQMLARLPAEALSSTALCPHPAARWYWFPAEPIRSLWQNNRCSDASPGNAPELRWEGEGILISRPAAEVVWTALDPGGVAFLDGCARGDALEDAMSQALEAQTDLDLARLMTTLLDAGCLVNTLTSTHACDESTSHE